MSDALILCPPQRVGGLERRHPMDLIHRPNKTITQFLSLSHTVGVHLKNFFCREDSRLTPQNNQPDEPKHQQMEPIPHAHTCQSYFRSGRTTRPTCAGSDVAFLVASAAFWESRFPAPQLFHSSVRSPSFLCRSMAIASLAAATLYSCAISFSVLMQRLASPVQFLPSMPASVPPAHRPWSGERPGHPRPRRPA